MQRGFIRTVEPILIGFLLVSFLLPAIVLGAEDPAARADELYRQRKDRAKVRSWLGSSRG